MSTNQLERIITRVRLINVRVERFFQESPDAWAIDLALSNVENAWRVHRTSRLVQVKRIVILPRGGELS